MLALQASIRLSGPDWPQVSRGLTGVLHMSDWIHNLPVGGTGVVVFGGTYLVTALIFLVVLGSAKGERLRTYKGVSPGLLPPLGIIFGLLVAFLAAQVWGDVDRANTAVNREASALRAAVLLSTSIPAQPGRQEVGDRSGHSL
jgi:hypothetical protein